MSGERSNQLVMSMPTLNGRSKRTPRNHKRFWLKSKKRGTTIFGLVIFIGSVLFVAYRTAGVVAAYNEWARLKRANPYSAEAVESALEVLNQEETGLIAPLLFAVLSSAVALRSVELKIIPRKCHYCGKWAKPKNVRQTPDKAFYYHEKCEPKG